MIQFLKNSWGLIFFMLAVFVGDRATSEQPNGYAHSSANAIDTAQIRALVNDLVFESLVWAQIGEVPMPNRPIVYVDYDGNKRSFNALPDLRRSFKGAYAIIALDSIPSHILDLPILVESDEVNNVAVKHN
jgi:hypothetical protein